MTSPRSASRKRASFELTDNEELFFDLLADLPVPCTDKDERITALVVNWIRWNLKATARPVDEAAQGRRRSTASKSFRAPPASVRMPAKRLIDFLKDTILKPRPEGRRPFKNMLEERKR